jgi:hypothetical protein
MDSIFTYSSINVLFGQFIQALYETNYSIIMAQPKGIGVIPTNLKICS